MNIQQFDTFIDATNKFSIEDLVNNVNTGNVGIGGTTASLNQFLFITSNSNLYLANSNIDSEIRFKVKNNINNPNYNPDYTTKIDKNGKLQVYHQYNLLQPTFSSGFYDVEYELLSLKADGITADLQLTALEASIVGLQLEIIAIDEYATNVNNSFAAFAEKLTPGIPTTPLSQNIQQQLQNIGTTYSTIRSTTQTKLEKYLAWGIYATAGALIGYAGYNAFANNAYEGVDNITYSNIPPYTPEEKNMLRRSIIDQQESNVSNYYNTHSNLNLIQGFINSNTFATQYIKYLNSDEIKINNTNVSNIFVASNVLSNINLNSGFINSNQTNQQIIPIIKTNKLMIGNITNPNNVYNLESTGDININELYRNNVSLTSTLNTKQGNLTFNNPLLNTIDIITLKRDASLTLDGSGNLSVVRTSSNPIVITGNNFSLNYDSGTLGLNGTNHLTVLPGTSSKWTTNGTSIYNNNTGNIGIGTNTPLQKLHVEDGSIFIGDSSVGDGSGVDNGYKLIFDSSYTATGANKCNKILLHNNTTGPTYIAGFGVENGALTYSIWTGGSHRFYTETTTASGGFLSAEIYKNQFRFYGSTDAGSGGVISNDSAGASAYSFISLANNTGNAFLFLNSSAKTSDGGANTLTLRNDVVGGDLRLSARSDSPFIYLKNSTGNVGIGINNPSGILHLHKSQTGQDVRIILTDGTTGSTNLDGFEIIKGASQEAYVWNYENAPLKFGTNGAERLIILADGNVGIGVASTTYKLDVNGSLNSTSLYTGGRLIQDHLFNNTGRTHTTYTNFNTPTDFGCHFIQGTTNGPSVNGAAQYYSMTLGLGSEYTNYKAQIAIPRNVGGPYLCVRYMENGTWSEWMKIASGVADNATYATFRIRSPTESTASSLDLGTPFNSSAANKVSIIAQGISSHSRSDLHICLNNTADNSVGASITDARITIKPSGNIGFGNSVVPTQASSATSYFLHLGNSQTSRIEDWNICFHKSTGNGSTRMFNIGYTEDDQGYNFYECMGDIGNNNTFSNWKYHFAVIYNAPDYCCIINNQGNMTLAGTYFDYSDEKIKTDVETIDNALEKIGDLRGVYYTNIIHEERKIGLIAQEVEMVIPEVITTEVLSDTKAVSYGNLVALLVEGIKELKQQINNLNNRIEILENR